MINKSPVLGPEIALAVAWAISGPINRLGQQLNPLQIPLVMDNAASKQLGTGTYKLPPINNYSSEFGVPFLRCSPIPICWRHMSSILAGLK